MYRYFFAGMFFIICCLSAPKAQTKLWVSPFGKNSNSGTAARPFADLSYALRKAREIRRMAGEKFKGDILIILKGGVYSLQEPVFIRPEDSGTDSSSTLIEAAADELPVLSGGVNIINWKLVEHLLVGMPQDALGKVWVAELPMYGAELLDFRQLYVNGKKAVRAKDTKQGQMNRILSWDHKAETCWIPRVDVATADAGGMEMFIQQWWATAVLRIKSLYHRGDSTRLSFEQPESRIQAEHPWPAPWISRETGNSAFYLSNSVHFLNDVGEWYLDKKNRKIYYLPREGENLAEATVVAPFLETLVNIQGTIDRPVAYVSFKGIAFQYSTWLRPSKMGHVPHQSGMYMLDAYKLDSPGTKAKKTLENQAWVGRPPAVVAVNYAVHVNFDACAFQHLGSTGLDYGKGTNHNRVSGNLFKDIAGTGIQAGTYSEEAQEVHIPYLPKDERELCSDLQISNNLLTGIANEDWGAVGIGAGYVKNIRIEHNDLSELSYIGISVGWGWTKTINAMKDNRVVGNKIRRYGKHLYDVSGIYTLSAQPGSLISSNDIDSIYKAPYPHDPKHWFYLYTDEGSSFITVKDNWTPAVKFLQNANGPGNVWINNGPSVSTTIKLKAGLEPAFRHLLRYRLAPDPDWKINQIADP